MIQRFVNQVNEFPGIATSGTITIPATAPGNVLVILAVSSHGTGVKWTAPNHISTTDGDFTEVPFYSLQAGVLWDWGSFPGSSTSSDILYQVTSGGVVSVNWNSNTRLDMICIREISGLQTPVVIDDFKMNGSASGLVVGSALVGSGGNDLCFENFATFNYNVAGSLETSPWMTDFGLADNGGSGALFQIGMPGTQPAPAPLDFSGNPANDQYTCTAVAFKGIGAAPTTPVDESGNPVTLAYAFSDNYNLRVGRFVDTNGNIHTIGPLYSNDWTFAFNFFNPDILGSGLGCPWGFTIIGQRDLYVVDQCNGRLWKIDIVTGICTRACGGNSPPFTGAPIGPALTWNLGFGLYTVKAGLDGNIYIGDPNYETIICLNLKNVPIVVGGITIPVGYAAEVAGFDTGQGFRSDYSVCADAAGNVYAGEEGNNIGQGNKVWKTDAVTGAATLIAGIGTAGTTGDGGPASAAELDAPLGLAIDLNGILYIACNGGNAGNTNGSIRAINLSGVPQTICGKTIAPGNIDSLYNPGGIRTTSFWALAPDYQGNVLVCDLKGSGGCPPAVPGGGSRGWMNIIDTAGVYSQIVGTPVTGDCGWSGDGGPAIAAVMGTAFGVAVPIPIPPLTTGTITIQKTVVSGTPADHTYPFTMRPSWKPPFTLVDGGSDVSTVPAGVYSITEDPVALINESISVSNGDPPSAIVVAGGSGVSTSYLVQKASVSGKVISFPFPTSLGNLIILVATWAEDALVGEQLEFGMTAPLCNFVTDDGANTWRQARNPDTNSIIMAVVAANSCQTITTDPHYFTTSIDDGPANPSGLRLRAYEVSNIPGPSGHLPEGSTNVQENGCVGLGQTTPGDPQSPSVNPASTIAAASWSDMIGDNGFFISVLAPNGGAGNDNFAGMVSAVAAPFVLDDPFGPTAVAYLDGASADADHTATFTWSNTAGWSILMAAWEAFGAPPPPPAADVIVDVVNTRSVPGPPGGTSFVPKPPIGHGPFQVVPTDNSPNQAWQVSVSVNNKSIPLGVVLRYNEIAKYWVATISDSQGNVLLDSIPLITGDNFTQNILRQFAYLGIGSAAIFNASAKSA